jgi:hypothetical protein
MRVICHAHLILFDLILVIIFGEEHKLWNSFNGIYTTELLWHMYRAVIFIWHQPLHCRFLCGDILNATQSLLGHTRSHAVVNKICYQVYASIKQENRLPFAAYLPSGPARQGDCQCMYHGTCLAWGQCLYACLLCSEFSSWQDKWTHTQVDKLWAMKQSVQVWQFFSSHWKEQAMLTHLTRRLLLQGDSGTICTGVTKMVSPDPYLVLFYLYRWRTSAAKTRNFLEPRNIVQLSFCRWLLPSMVKRT